MDLNKKNKLKKAGWKVGNTKDFLGLTDAESEYIDIKVSFGRSVRELRTKSKITQVELAEMVESSQSRIAKLEAGDPSVSLDLQIKTLLALGASRIDLARYLKGN
ncbi:helix-turn-helix domain-containing protein [bacterium]|jgi:DNA-binding XRE family transcriptional regulator|nr:helix-turn-helix domain-containing protein [bacterium]